MGNERAKRVRPDPAGAGLLEWVEGLLRRVVREELAAAAHPADDWRDQRQSQLGPRRHCLAVRRRLRADPEGRSAKILGNRFLLTLDAIAEEMERLGRKPDDTAAGVTAPSPPQSPESEALARVQRRLQRVK